jgi:hypothetical protein
MSLQEVITSRDIEQSGRIGKFKLLRDGQEAQDWPGMRNNPKTGQEGALHKHSIKALKASHPQTNQQLVSILSFETQGLRLGVRFL